MLTYVTRPLVGYDTTSPCLDVNFCNVVGFLYFSLVLCNHILTNICIQLILFLCAYVMFYFYLIIQKTVLLSITCGRIATDTRALLATEPIDKYKNG